MPEPGSAALGPVAPVALPAWRRALAAGSWLEIPTADLRLVGPAVVPGRGAAASRIDAWNGMAALDTRVCMAGVGGHADWGGNEGYCCDLAAELPVWTMLNDPTPSNLITIDTTHYLDGRPTSSHTYYSLHGDTRRNKVFRLGIGSAFGTGNYQRPNVDAFDLTLNDWDRAGTWPDVPEAVGIGRSQAQDSVTGDVYVAGLMRLWRFRMSSGTWTALAPMPQNATAVYYRAAAVDPLRQRVVFFGDAYRTPLGALVYDIAANTWHSTYLSGPYAATVAAAAGHQAHYHHGTDRFLLKTSSAGQLIEVHPETLATRTLDTAQAASVPNAVNGVFGKFVHLPLLDGYAYQPSGTQRLWFLSEL
jgi:hypothetical protein